MGDSMITPPQSGVPGSRSSIHMDPKKVAECEAIFGVAVQTVKGIRLANTYANALWKGVFDRWTSNKMPAKPRYKSRQAADSSIQVGVFKCDLPSRKDGPVLS
ncbi:hypothetical protein OIDMADRAFT_54684 [Oidiodendron maius Zn]|uniref:Uncharacterized protein n=1 Tax=Oidiodendron maius (strain Zn) TaxID=913774 RepID=A0A0C3HCI8_OIDMZ|nr:hypothetical protein OIDMADRAFT_54684 [Oidiodendron maius Zn]